MNCECDHVDQVPLDDFLPYIMPSVKGVPAEIAAHNARLAAIQLARESMMLERTVWMYAQAGMAFYPEPILPDCYTFMSISSVCVLGCTHKPLRSLPHCIPCKHYYYEKGHGLHIDAPSCDAHRGIEITMKVVPGQDTCFVDRCMYDMYAEAIQHGALSRLYAMSSAEWFDPSLARYHRGLYQEQASSAGVLVQKAHSSEPMMIKPRRWV